VASIGDQSAPPHPTCPRIGSSLIAASSNLPQEPEHRNKPNIIGLLHPSDGVTRLYFSRHRLAHFSDGTLSFPWSKVAGKGIGAINHDISLCQPGLESDGLGADPPRFQDRSDLGGRDRAAPIPFGPGSVVH
jgi:hypothetical protein